MADLLGVECRNAPNFSSSSNLSSSSLKSSRSHTRSVLTLFDRVIHLSSNRITKTRAIIAETSTKSVSNQSVIVQRWGGPIFGELTAKCPCRYRTGARRKAGVFRIALPASGRLDSAVYLLGAVLAPVTGGL